MTNEHLEYYGERYRSLALRDLGVTFEKYVTAPAFHEARALRERIRKGITRAADADAVANLEATIAWAKRLAATALLEIGKDARARNVLSAIVEVCEHGPRGAWRSAA